MRGLASGSRPTNNGSRRAPGCRRSPLLTEVFARVHCEVVMNRALVSVMIGALLCGAASVAAAQQAFKTPDEAASALVQAAKAGDMKALVTVLGPDGEDIVS